MTSYPTIDEVNKSDRRQICAWYRYLPSPGSSAIGQPHFQMTLEREVVIMDRIVERFHELGGMTPAISKAIGWGN